MFEKDRGLPANLRLGKSARSHLGLENLEERAMPAVISGWVYNDVNNNGIRQSGEAGIAGSTLTLYNAQNQAIATTTSNSMGYYQFTQRTNVSPTPGQMAYEATFARANTNTIRGQTSTAVQSSAGGTLQTTSAIQKFNAALGTLTSIEIIAEGQVNSNVRMENLDAQTIPVEGELHSTIRYTVGGATVQGTADTTVNATLGAFDGTADLMGSSSRNFGNTQMIASFNRTTLSDASTLAAFTGTGTVDVSQDARATSCACGSGNLMAMIRSTVEGKVRVVYNYTPSRVIGPGVYRIVQSPQPSGYTDGYETRGNTIAIARSNTTDTITVGVVTNTDVITENNFGEILGASISGRVYHDVDRNGSFSSGDLAISGVTVLLTGTDIFGRSISRSFVTNANGGYGFSGLAAGSYTIREIQPTGYLQGTNNIGSAGGTVSGDTFTSITLGQSTRAMNYNFGEVTQPSDPLINQDPSKYNHIGTNLGGFVWTW